MSPESGRADFKRSIYILVLSAAKRSFNHE